MSNWKEQTCEKCTFRVDDECRRFPPTKDSNAISGESTGYPEVREYTSQGFFKPTFGYIFKDACSEFKETL